MSPSIPDESFDSDSGRMIGRFDDTVRRRVGAWTPAVHGLLRYLENAGFPYSPRVRGIDEEGNEVLTRFEGQSCRDAWARVASEDGLRAFARLLRSYHDAVADYRPAAQSWGTVNGEPDANEIICHGDFGPWKHGLASRRTDRDHRLGIWPVHVPSSTTSLTPCSTRLRFAMTMSA